MSPSSSTKILYSFLAALLLVQLTACGGRIPPGAIETAVAGTLAVAPALQGEVIQQEKEITRVVEVTRLVKVEVTSTPKAESKATPTATPRGQTPTNEVTATPEGPTATPEPTLTLTVAPSGNLGLSLNQFITKYNGMTDLQKQEYIASLPGKKVSWTGQVYNVTLDGLVVLENPYSVGTIILKGIPHEVAIKLDRTMLADFTGMIESFDGSALIEIVVTDAKILRYYVPPTSTPTAEPKFFWP